MNNRGSALVYVLAVTAILIVLGSLALQVVAADAKFARFNSNRALALQLAEGGLDYGIELILQAPDITLIAGSYELMDNITVNIQDLGINRYLISSTAVLGNSTRSVHLEILHTPLFGHSLYVGDTVGELDLKNVAFEGPVHIYNPKVNISSNNVTFYSGVHFETSPENVTGHAFHVGTGFEATYGPSDIDPPSINIELLEASADNNGDEYTSPHNHKYSTTVNFNDLMVFNYFDVEDLVITWNGNVGAAPGATVGSDVIIIVNTGNVRFAGGGKIADFGSQLIIIAGGNISGEDDEDDLKSIELPLYLYAEGSIRINNNMKNIRSVIAKGGFKLGSGNEEWEFYKFESVNIPGLQDAWGTFITVKRWIN